MSERERRKCLEVLGVPYDASDDDIKKNYYKLAKQYHPDKNTEPGAKERFQEIGYAYKYLTEGPQAVGAEDEEDGIPFEVFVRLFPWLNGAFNPFGNPFGGPFGNPFFEHIHYGGHSFHREHHYGGHHHGGHHYHDYEEAFFPGFYDDSDDSDYDDYSYTRPSTYVPGPTKEEKKKEKKKKAKERRKAAKMGKQSHAASQARSNSSRNTKDSQQTSKQTADRTDSSTTAPNNFTNVFPTHNSNAHDSCAPDVSSAKKAEQEKLSNGSTHKNKVTGTEKVKDTLRAEDVKVGGHDSSGASVGIPSQNAHGKKSKKKLKAEQKQREKEMELIAAEFKKKQKEQEEKEAQRKAVRQERKERETTLGRQDLEGSVVDNDSVITGNDSESVEDVDADDEAAAVMEDVDDDLDGDLEIDGIEDGQDRSARSRGEKDKQFMTHNMSSMQASGKTDVSNGGHARQKTSSRPVPQQQQQHGATPKTYYHDNRGSSQGGGADVKEESLRRRRKKYKPQEFEEDPEVDGVHGSAYSVLMPQSEAEEMRMFHEALLRSEMEAQQQDDFENVAADGTGVMPQTEAEEQAMLQAALRQSQTANWHGNIQTLDDVSDGDDSIFSGGSSGRDSGRSSGTLWHSSIGKNSSKRQENSEMSSPPLRGSSSRPNLGGLGTGSCGFGSTISGDRGASTGTADHIGRGASGKHDQFDRTVGGRVKGKDRKAPEHGGKQDEAWEFGGSKLGPSFKSDNADGIQFGFDDDGGAEIKEKHFQTFYNSNYKSDQDEGKNRSSNTFPVDAQTKTDRSQNATVGQISPGHTDNNTPQVSVLDGYQKIPPPPMPNISKLQTSSAQSEAQNRSHSSSVPVHQDSLYKSSHTSAVQSAATSAATSASTSAIINDMDDIDDVDTFEESSAATFSYPSQPSSSFSLDIPSAMCNKERMKSYYNYKK